MRELRVRQHPSLWLLAPETQRGRQRCTQAHRTAAHSYGAQPRSFPSRFLDSFVPDRSSLPAQLYQEKVKYNLAGKNRKGKGKSNQVEGWKHSLLFPDSFCSFTTSCIVKLAWTVPISPSFSKRTARTLGTGKLWLYPRSMYALSNVVKHQTGWNIRLACVQIPTQPFTRSVPWAAYFISLRA